MAIRQVVVERVTLVSPKPFAEVLAAIEEAIGHPNWADLSGRIAAAQSWQELEGLVHAETGPADLMLFARYDLGQVLTKANGSGAPKMVRLVVGNPLIMKQMAEHVPDAGSYAPVTILVDERPAGVHVSYDRMASYLAPYGNLAALRVAEDLDAKVEDLLRNAAA